MSARAQIVADSISECGVRMLGFELEYQRFILPELNTHRALSKSTSSSRAIPTKKLIQMVRDNPAMPVHFGKNQPGMQAAEELDYDSKMAVQRYWRLAADKAADLASVMADFGTHKQIVNRILEPYLWVKSIVSGTEWANFFALRRHPDAQPEIKALADAMWEAMQASTPTLLRHGEWHLPYVTAEDYRPIQMASGRLGVEWIELARKVSAARAARTSYKTHDGRVSTVDEDLELFHRLVGGNPIHASPTEHQATPDRPLSIYEDVVGWERPHLHGNLKGFVQFRKLLPNENITEYAG